MKNILREIIEHKHHEVAERKELHPVKLLERSIYFESQPVSLRRYLTRPDKVGIIAEIKRRSPSKGEINSHISVEHLSLGYMQAGASALSILTDTKYFGGKNDDLSVGWKFNFCPILRKDFMVDPYQVAEARALGADCILIIMAEVDDGLAGELAAAARHYGMDAIVEVHDAAELERALELDAELVGINNRNLKTFEVSLSTTERLAPFVPRERIVVGESGINSPADLARLERVGVRTFLVGESLMRQPDVTAATRALLAREAA